MKARVPRVLLVDDEPRNLRLLEAILSPLGYDLCLAQDGRQAIARALETAPDVVLLDVLMPGHTGIEVCRRLKAEAATRHIPVVLVTALSDRESRLAGLEAGADDFLGRPVDATELRTRVKALLRTKALYDELQQRYEQLRRLEESRESLAQMIVHDLRNPLVSVIGYLDLLEAGYVSGEAACDSVRVVKRSAQRLIEMVAEILDVAKLEAGQMRLERAPLDLAELCRDVATEVRPLLESQCLALDVEIPSDLPLPIADRDALRRILVNIVSNAVAFSPKGTRIALAARHQESGLRVSVRDAGPGIGLADQQRIFEKFGSRGKQGRSYSTGLGLAFCKLAVEAHGGQIGVESAPGQGSTFWFCLPLAPASSPEAVALGSW
jgi:signal transduction histidine kinase